MNTIEQAEARAAAMRVSSRGEYAIVPRGTAVVTVNRLSRQLAARDTADRAVVREMLADLLSELDQTAWSSFGDAPAVQDYRP